MSTPFKWSDEYREMVMREWRLRAEAGSKVEIQQLWWIDLARSKGADWR